MTQNAASSVPEDIKREVEELVKQRPVFCAIAERVGELSRQQSKLSETSPECKSLESRKQRLLPYMGELPSSKPKRQQDRMVQAFFRSLANGVIGRKGQPITDWDDINFLTDGFQKYIRKRPRGNPPIYRHRVTEALELKLHHSDWTWAKIAGHLQLDISLDDLKRQITLLKKLLREENITF